MTDVEVQAVRCGEIRVPLAWVERPRGRLAVRELVRPDQRVALSLLFFVVRHPEAGVLVIDTGLHPDASQSVRGDFGLVTSVAFRGLEPAERSFAEQLREAGVEPAAVRQAVMTHLHADHTSGMRLLPEAEFVVCDREWAAATRRDGSLNGYAPKHLPDAARVRRVGFDGAEPHGPFERTIDLLGDGSVRLLATPGHSPGHMSLLLETAERPVLVVGDAVYRMRNLEHDILPFRTADEGRYQDSARQLRAYAQSTPEAVLIPTHDDQAWRAL